MKRRLSFIPLLTVVFVAVLALSACSGTGTPTTTVDDGSSVTTDAPDTTEAPDTTSAPVPTDAPPSPGDESGDAGGSSSNTTMILLIGFAVIVIIALLAWLVGRNSGSSDSSRDTPMAPPVPDRTTLDDRTGTPPDPDTPGA